MKHTVYRPVSSAERAAMEQRGCSATDWGSVEVSTEGFDPSKLSNVHFSGCVRLNPLEGTFTRPGGLVRHSCIEDATLHNVCVGSDVYIRRIGCYIANYDIADGAYIENTDSITATLDSTFGIGTEVSVLNETGGREVPIYDRLSAQTAYLIALYRHRPDTVDALRKLIGQRASQMRGRRGYIGRNAEIVNCGTISNVIVGDYARIKGATRLTDGYIASSETDPVTVGRDVIAEGFVFASGSRVDDGAVVHHCFIGQASSLSHLFSAHDSLFFANCNCENGEAAAIFGGPYTVTMHKSSLLIAGIFSFLNAGSGSNQSNHMYKLGPIHQGVVERGSKTTSDSYLLWPAKIGAFSLVMGRHVNHPDTSRLPFSYLIENREGSYLVPGINLGSVGTVRDAQKWPRRDRRRDPDHLDCINFNLLSPFTVGKMFSGVRLLDELERTSGITASRFAFQAMIIEARALRRGRDYYRLAIDKFMGNSLISRLDGVDLRDDAAVRRCLAPSHPDGCGDWVDICGLFAPKQAVERISDYIATGQLSSLEEIEAVWQKMHADYYDMEWTWVAEHFEEWYGKPVTELTGADIRSIVERWIEAVTRIDDMLMSDARKEYSLKSRTGFGIDDPAAAADSDFMNVRGNFDDDPFVRMVIEHSAAKRKLAESVLARLG